MNDLTVEQIGIKKIEFQEALRIAIDSFESQTGCAIDSIDIVKQALGHGGNVRVRIDISVSKDLGGFVLTSKKRGL